MTEQEIGERLRAPFPAQDLEWKPQTVGITNGKPWCQIVPYISARAIQDRLDQLFGPFGWDISFRPETIAGIDGVLATMRVRPLLSDPDFPPLWVAKQDGSEPTELEPFKGALSSAMKRVAVQFGIGRYLYHGSGPVWAVIHDGGDHRARGKTKKGEAYDFRWGVPPDALGALTAGALLPDGVTEDGEVLDTPAPEAPRRRPSSAPPRDRDEPEEQEEPSGDIPDTCPKCGGGVWDNRLNKRNPKAPDWKCKDKECIDPESGYVTGGWRSKTPKGGDDTAGGGPGLDGDHAPLEEEDDDLPY